MFFPGFAAVIFRRARSGAGPADRDLVRDACRGSIFPPLWTGKAARSLTVLEGKRSLAFFERE